ncbi:hypothetical protein [Luteolibacter sp. AS25]|uniref:hypothetical protein n=1 Tax=Luteolibacter sp. AS25 TaxID=3135776 RepID=UPI00398AC4FE
MQNYCKTIGALAAASALAAGNASAEVEFELHTGYSTEYIFRGLDLGDDLTEVGIDAAYNTGALTTSAGVWAAFFGDTGTGNQIDSEVDLYTEAAYDFGYLTGAVGYIYYYNLGRLGADAQEVYFSVSKELYGFETSLTYFWDVAGSGIENDGYMEAYAGYGYELNSCLTLNNGLTFGFLAEQGEFSHVQFRTSLDWAFSENATLAPYVQYSRQLTDEAAYNSSKDELIAGTILAVSF